ncbi:hypothetical protein PG993_006662 [Apiospora rasikravindrae]|uniref:Uncharacterized protein n=1 Tax=Apiospora rasikravindrae TaxID=990691 RepID=A0ABR1T8I0_9PEZI
MRSSVGLRMAWYSQKAGEQAQHRTAHHDQSPGAELEAVDRRLDRSGKNSSLVVPNLGSSRERANQPLLGYEPTNLGRPARHAQPLKPPATRSFSRKYRYNESLLSITLCEKTPLEMRGI